MYGWPIQEKLDGRDTWHIWRWGNAYAYKVLVRKPERERDHSEYLSADWIIILKWILNTHKRGGVGVEWINLVRDMGKWRTPVNAVI